MIVWWIQQDGNLATCYRILLSQVLFPPPGVGATHTVDIQDVASSPSVVWICGCFIRR